MDSLLEQLHDIEGIDPISWWPLAIGWWMLIIFTLCVIGLIACFAIKRWAFMRSWKSETLKNLNSLEKKLSEITARETIIDLSQYLRRIAVRRFSRKECAGLNGKAWLRWLAANDPKEFDWENKGALLINIPYAPHNVNVSTPQIKELIQAVRNWVC